MTNPTQDRNYYRMLTDEELLDLKDKIQTNEMAIVLAERLRKARRKLEEGHYTHNADRHTYDSQFD